MVSNPGMSVMHRPVAIVCVMVVLLEGGCGEKQPLTKKEAAIELANASCRRDDDCMLGKFDECVPAMMTALGPLLPDAVDRGALAACIASIEARPCKETSTPEPCKKLVSTEQDAGGRSKKQGVAAMFEESREKIAKLAVDQFAFRNAPQWQVSSGKACPDSLLAIAQLMGKGQQDILDPWGTPYEMFCGRENLPAGASGAYFAVMSYGPDKKKGTEDDIKSWEPLR